MRGNAQIDQRVLVGSIQPKREPFRAARALRLFAAIVEKQLVAADKVLLERRGGKIWVPIAREKLDALDPKASTEVKVHGHAADDSYILALQGRFTVAVNHRL